MKNQKLLIIVIAVVVLGLGGYLYFSGKSTSSDTPSPTRTLSSDTTGANPVALTNDSSTASVSNSAQASEIITLLKNISSIRLETRILQSPSFLALVDSSIILPPIAVSGRVNPFSSTGASISNTIPATENQTTATTGTTAAPVTTTTSTRR